MGQKNDGWLDDIGSLREYATHHCTPLITHVLDVHVRRGSYRLLYVPHNYIFISMSQPFFRDKLITQKEEVLRHYKHTIIKNMINRFTKEREN